MFVILCLHVRFANGKLTVKAAPFALSDFSLILYVLYKRLKKVLVCLRVRVLLYGGVGGRQSLSPLFLSSFVHRLKLNNLED
jgi:hypothetical protein